MALQSLLARSFRRSPRLPTQRSRVSVATLGVLDGAQPASNRRKSGADGLRKHAQGEGVAGVGMSPETRREVWDVTPDVELRAAGRSGLFQRFADSYLTLADTF